MFNLKNDYDENDPHGLKKDDYDANQTHDNHNDRITVTRKKPVPKQ
jgi:hypothetical protein